MTAVAKGQAGLIAITADGAVGLQVLDDAVGVELADHTGRVPSGAAEIPGLTSEWLVLRLTRSGRHDGQEENKRRGPVWHHRGH